MLPSDVRETARKIFIENAARNIFVIMRYKGHAKLKEIQQAVIKTLREKGLRAILADEYEYEEGVWNNVKFCMENTRYAIAVLENIGNPEPMYNANVAIEVGYMIARNKECLLLKDESFDVPADIGWRYYQPFDSHYIETSMIPAILKWVDNVVLGGMAIRAESITDDNAIKAQKKRTLRIIEEYEKVLGLSCMPTIRLAGLVSSLAASSSARRLADTDGELQSLVLKERDLLVKILEKGTEIRCIIAPHIYVERASRTVAELENVQPYYIPRYDTLIQTILGYQERDSFKILWAMQLPRHGLITIGDRVAFIGSRTPAEERTRITVVHDTIVIQHENDEFDYAFEDSITQFGKKNGIDSTDPQIFRDLKKSVINRLSECRQTFVKLVAGGENP